MAHPTPYPALALAVLSAGCSAGEPPAPGTREEPTAVIRREDSTDSEERTEVATLGAGCFWCVEAVLEQIDGVLAVSSGYMGGTVESPTYPQVSTGETGHAEVVQVTFDGSRLSYGDLLDWFWRLHDPTTPNRQGADVGSQYRSAIFYHSPAQREIAEASRAAAEDSGAFEGPIVTEITPAGPFWEAENYHQDYYRGNRGAPYCRAVIRPKLRKLHLDE